MIRINLESLDYYEINDYLSLYNLINGQRQKDKQNYIFIDEVQNVPDFQKTIDDLFMKENCDVYITGSNAYLLIYVGKVGTAEVDFIAIHDNGEEYDQVAYTVVDADGSILKRELAPLNAIKDHNPKFLLTMDYIPPTSHNGIRQKNALDWLLQD